MQRFPMLNLILFPCLAGYYCTGSASTHSPTDGMTGDICPMGYFCPRGSVIGLPCPIGYYLNATGSSVMSSCIICNKGKAVNVFEYL